MNRSCWVVLRTDGTGERKRADKWGNLLILSARRRSKDAARANRMEVAMIMNVNMQVGAKQHPYTLKQVTYDQVCLVRACV